MEKLYTPNAVVPLRTMQTIALGWVTVWLAGWTLLRYPIFPSPVEVLQAFPELWLRDGLGDQLIRSSLVLNLKALALSILLSLPLAYLSRAPLFMPLAFGISKLRFISPAVFFLILLFATGSGHALKVWMLALGETFFLLTSAIVIVQAVPDAALDDARTLQLNEWQVTWYAVIRGTLADVLKAIRDNAAIGWSMVMMVEGFVRSEGGVGVMILNRERHMDFAQVYAIAGAVILVGIAQDCCWGWIRRTVCPYAK